jgi:hypothetical protein
MSLINSLRNQKTETQLLDDIIDYNEAGAILGLAPKTVANGNAGTHVLERVRQGSRKVGYKKSQVVALKERWLSGDGN